MYLLSVKFYLNSILLGVGLAMDAFSVSIANGISEGKMKTKRRIRIAGCYSIFQFIMPVIGWCFVKELVSVIKALEPFIPIIGFLLLLYLGGKMIIEELFSKSDEASEDSFEGCVTDRMLLLQGIATSIDALSVGFTIEKYAFVDAFVAALIIGLVTFVICMIGLKIGIRFGSLLAKRATVAGGIILILIGFEILLT